MPSPLRFRQRWRWNPAESRLCGFFFFGGDSQRYIETLGISFQPVISFPGGASRHAGTGPLAHAGHSRDSRWNRTRVAMVRMLTPLETHDGKLPLTTHPQCRHIFRYPYQVAANQAKKHSANAALISPISSVIDECHRRPSDYGMRRIHLRVYPIATIFFP